MVAEAVVRLTFIDIGARCLLTAHQLDAHAKRLFSDLCGFVEVQSDNFRFNGLAENENLRLGDIETTHFDVAEVCGADKAAMCCIKHVAESQTERRCRGC